MNFWIISDVIGMGDIEGHSDFYKLAIFIVGGHSNLKIRLRGTFRL